MLRLQKILLLLSFALVVNLTAGVGNASALWLTFRDETSQKADLVMLDIQIDSTAKSTYYAPINFSGGYCGLQDHGDSRTLHFSLWHNKEGQGSDAKLVWRGYHVDPNLDFPEGIGGVKTTRTYDWKVDSTYRLLIKYRHGDYLEQSGAFRDFWFYNFTEEKWFHMATIWRSDRDGEKEYPTDIGSFIEDFGRSKERYRSYFIFNAAKKNYSGNDWHYYTKARYSKNKDDFEHANGKVIDNKFHLATGGDFIPDDPTPSGTILEVDKPDISPERPGLQNIQVENMNDTTMKVSWEYANKLWAAQEYFEIRIYSDESMNNSVYKTGRLYPHNYDPSPLRAKDDRFYQLSHREYELSGLNLDPDKRYYLRLITRSIFGYNSWNNDPVVIQNYTYTRPGDKFHPEGFRINKIYPNPFNSRTTIEYTLSSKSKIAIDIYNLKGNKIKTLYSGIQNAGKQKISWKGLDQENKKVQTGIYFCVIKSGNKRRICKLTIIK